LANAAILCFLACGAPRSAPTEGDVRVHIDIGISRGTGVFDHGTWDALLDRYAHIDGRKFDYPGLKTEEERFENYLSSIASANLSGLSAAEIKALFINAYNAFTIRTVLDHVSEDGTYYISSIRDIKDVFRRDRHTVGGFRLSLDNIEHNILRPVFKDPRIHFSVNCASFSCPPLPIQAFTGKSLDEQLEEVTRSTLQDVDYVSIEEDVLLLTKILDWYGGDFVNPHYRGSEKTLAEFVRKYATAEVASFIESRGTDLPIRFRYYDWTLNKP
jgi:hypothetical protein